MFNERIAGATTFEGSEERWLSDKSRRVKEGDHFVTSGNFCNLL